MGSSLLLPAPSSCSSLPDGARRIGTLFLMLDLPFFLMLDVLFVLMFDLPPSSVYTPSPPFLRHVTSGGSFACLLMPFVLKLNVYPLFLPHVASRGSFSSVFSVVLLNQVCQWVKVDGLCFHFVVTLEVHYPFLRASDASRFNNGNKKMREEGGRECRLF